MLNCPRPPATQAQPVSLTLNSNESERGPLDYVYLHGDEIGSGGAEERGHREFRKQQELRGQTEKRCAGALKLCRSQIQEGKT